MLVVYFYFNSNPSPKGTSINSAFSSIQCWTLKGSFYYSANPHDEEELCIRILKILVELINSQKAPSETSDSGADGDESHDSPKRLTPRSHLLIHYFSTEQQSSLQKDHDKSAKGAGAQLNILTVWFYQWISNIEHVTFSIQKCLL